MGLETTSGDGMDQSGLIASLRAKPGLRLGIMGGAFDPIHMAHLVVAEEALLQFRLDQVLFMPAGDPPHKDRRMPPADLRYLLVSAATAGNPRFSVSRFEIDRDAASYTVDTLEYLSGVVAPGSELFFLIGGDAALDILTWKRPERVLELASFIVATRPGYDLSRLSESLEQIELRSPAPGAADRVKVMEIPGLAISSSMIRQRLAEGKPVRYLVPDLVAELIEKSGFYV